MVAPRLFIRRFADHRNHGVMSESGSYHSSEREARPTMLPIMLRFKVLFVQLLEIALPDLDHVHHEVNSRRHERGV